MDIYIYIYMERRAEQEETRDVLLGTVREET